MSRIGRMPIPVPGGVKVHVADGTVRVEGPKGKLSRAMPREVTVAVDGSTVNVGRTEETRRARGLHRHSRQLVANMVEGV
jgi:large subunit ribosomal protein L6